MFDCVHNTFQTNENIQFYCIKCLAETLPLQYLDNNQFDFATKGIDYPDEVNIDEIILSTSQLDMIRKINDAISKGFDVTDDKTDNDNESEVHPIDCKYYTTDQFNNQKFNSNKHFSLLHLNIHSLEFHIEELRIALKLINLKFDFICLTESKIKKDNEPKTDITIDGYQHPVGTPTEASKGGVLIYAKEGIDFKPREDLHIYKPKELESHFIEAINEKGKNIIIGTIYRHPCMYKNLFIDEYMLPLNDKLAKENKKTYLAGDFNFDFLNTDDNENFYFFETMMANHMLPTITIPTKINPKRNTVIDNIFTNQIHPDMISGNLTVAISDHLHPFSLYQGTIKTMHPRNKISIQGEQKISIE